MTKKLVVERTLSRPCQLQAAESLVASALNKKGIIFYGLYAKAGGNIIQLGYAGCLFLSANLQSSVVGYAAGILLEGDEARSVRRHDSHPRLLSPFE